jgi:hypothetical protein
MPHTKKHSSTGQSKDMENSMSDNPTLSADSLDDSSLAPRSKQIRTETTTTYSQLTINVSQHLHKMSKTKQKNLSKQVKNNEKKKRPNKKKRGKTLLLWSKKDVPCLANTKILKAYTPWKIGVLQRIFKRGVFIYTPPYPCHC